MSLTDKLTQKAKPVLRGVYEIASNTFNTLTGKYQRTTDKKVEYMMKQLENSSNEELVNYVRNYNGKKFSSFESAKMPSDSDVFRFVASGKILAKRGYKFNHLLWLTGHRKPNTLMEELKYAFTGDFPKIE